MSSRVRLLPTLIGAAGVLLALRIGAMAETADNQAGGGAPPPAQNESGGAAEKPPAAAEPSKPEPAQAPPAGLDPVAGAAQSKGEADVLQKLSERRAALDSRERDLSLREQLLLAAEKQMAGRLTELKVLEQRLDVIMAKRNEAEEAQVNALVKTYETMKAEDAARIFNRLERTILVDVASRMKPAKIASVMAAMEPARAQDLTVMLVRRLKVSMAPPDGEGMAPAPAAPGMAPPVPEGAATPAPGNPPPAPNG